MPTTRVGLVSLAAMLAAMLHGCAEQSHVTCGPGTKVENARCVTAQFAQCGDGTHLVGDACVPDSSLRCGAGTIEEDGACVRDRSLVCGAGTVERAGVCVLADPLERVTVPEGREPNLPPAVTRFDLPAIGAAPAVLGGTIAAPIGGNPDFDGFAFTGKRHQRLRIVAKAIGAPVVGFAVQPLAEASSGNVSYTRFALTSETRGATRDLVLPFDGDYLLLVSDQSNLTQGVPMGAEDFTYTIDVSQVSLPPAKTLVPGTDAEGDVAALDQYGFDVTADEPLFDVVLAPPDPAVGFPGVRALWGTADNGTFWLNALDDTTYGYLEPIPPTRVAPPIGRALLTVDHQYVLGSDLPAYSLAITPVAHERLGALETPVERTGSLAETGNNVFSVNLTANALLEVEVTLGTSSQIAPLLEIRNARYETVASVQGTRIGLFGTPLTAGRYYVAFSDRTFSATKTRLDYTLRAAQTAVIPVGPVPAGTNSEVTGTIVDGRPLWFAVYAGNDERLSITVIPQENADVALGVWPVDLKRPIAESASAAAGIVERASNILVRAGDVRLAKVTGPAGPVTVVASATESHSQWEREPNDNQAQANLLSFSNGHAEIAGMMTSISDYDSFQVRVFARATLTAATLPGVLGGRIDTRLYLMNGTGTQLLSNDDIGGGNDLSLLTRVVDPGTYYLRVERWTGYPPFDGEDYMLSVDLVP